ncbi:GntR family transcriptional regulator [Thermophagus xiamenensis]|uniref:Transcriptional regulator, GntR family n=1 Tax=Thermophagus xiamenensis TaxID=385682 RepID=A0A1I2AWE0_9BACT|nr:GntR family transcriptional regulator [Thermophagus xiamenensis]SFE48136.1 transcriptional regulator, GntR family [Thermophagus xiamenensis]
MYRKIINIDKNKGEPRYRQIINSVLQSIRMGKLKNNEKLPSVNDIAGAFNISRDTVMLAYNELKARGIVRSVPGKGYYIDSVDVEERERIFLLFDEFNAFKEDLYNSFIQHLEGRAMVDIFFHHFNPEVFASLVLDRKERYTSYVIMPANLPNVLEILNQLSQKRVYLLDRNPEYINDRYPCVYQDFHWDMYNGLCEGLGLLMKYKKLVLVYPGGKEPEGFLTGFKLFCERHRFPYQIIPSFQPPVLKGHVYILPNDRDLVHLVKDMGHKKLVAGRDVGIISLNDTGLKEIVAGGITTLSTDFVEMGKNLAQLVLSNKKICLKNPSRLNIRNSL